MGIKLSAEQQKAMGISSSSGTRVNIPRKALAKATRPRIKVPPLGLPVEQITVQLPWPPTVNSYYRNIRGKTLISKGGRLYRKSVISICRKKVNAHTVGRLTVTIWAAPADDRDRDLDNLFKAVLDSLQKAGVIRNDADIDDLRIKRSPKEARARVVVRITGEKPTDLFKEMP